jgi:hypothetical protein
MINFEGPELKRAVAFGWKFNKNTSKYPKPLSAGLSKGKKRITKVKLPCSQRPDFT